MLFLFPYKCLYSLSVPWPVNACWKPGVSQKTALHTSFCNSTWLLPFHALTIPCKKESLVPSADFAWLLWFWSLFHQCKEPEDVNITTWYLFSFNLNITTRYLFSFNMSPNRLTVHPQAKLNIALFWENSQVLFGKCSNGETHLIIWFSW